MIAIDSPIKSYILIFIVFNISLTLFMITYFSQFNSVSSKYIDIW